MNALPLPRPLRGIIPPLVTPLIDQDQIDTVGTEALIEHVIAGGVHGVFVRLLAKCPAQKTRAVASWPLRHLLVFRNSENEPIEHRIDFADVF